MAVLSMIMFLVISLLRWPFADDYGFIRAFENKGVFEYAWYIYANLDARWIMPLTVISLAIFKYLGFTASMLVASVNFALSAYFTVRILDKKGNWKLSKYDTFIMTAALNFIIWVLSYDYLSSSLYWFSATPYNLSIAGGLAWIYYYITRTEKKFGWLFYISVFIATSTPQMVSVPILFIVLFDLYNNWSNQRRRSLLILSLFIVFVILASTISPGSFNQYNLMHHDVYYTQSGAGKLKMYLLHFIEFNRDALNGRFLYFILFALVIIASVYGLKGRVLKDGFVEFKKMWQLNNVKYIIIAFSSLIIYWPTFLTGGRYYEAFTYYFLIGIILYAASVFKVRTFDRVNVYQLLPLLLLFACSIFIYGRVINQSLIVKRFMTYRDHALKTSGDKQMNLEAVDFNTFSRPVRSVEIGPDASYFINNNMAVFYGKDSVRAVKYLNIEDMKKRFTDKQK